MLALLSVQDGRFDVICQLCQLRHMKQYTPGQNHWESIESIHR